jgi:hypothetical protein
MSIIPYPVFQVVAIQKESVDFVVIVLSVFLFGYAFVDSLKSFIPSFHTLELFFIHVQDTIPSGQAIMGIMLFVELTGLKVPVLSHTCLGTANST